MLFIFQKIGIVFKIDKTESKDFNEEEHWQSEKEEFETLDRPISVLWQAFLEKYFSSMDESYCLTMFCQKFFLIVSLIRNYQK